jgi:hypothetical protein
MSQELIPPSPIITSQRAGLLDIIGPDCWDIIDDYKNSIEEYEQNFINIEECLNECNIDKVFNLSINLQELYDYCIDKEYDFNIIFKISINDKLSSTSYSLNNLSSNYLRFVKLYNIKFHYAVKTHNDISNNYFIVLDLGSHYVNDISLLQKVIFNALISNNSDIVSEYFGKHVKYLYDDCYLTQLLNKYLQI